MQHAWKHVERPGGSHTALDGKKNQRTHKHNKQAGGKESAGKAEEDRSGVQYATHAAERDDSVT